MVLMPIHPCNDMSVTFVDIKKYEDKSNIVFFRELGFLSEIKIPLHYIFLD